MTSFAWPYFIQSVDAPRFTVKAVLRWACKVAADQDMILELRAECASELLHKIKIKEQAKSDEREGGNFLHGSDEGNAITPIEHDSTVYYRGQQWIVQYISNCGDLDIKKKWPDDEKKYGVPQSDLDSATYAYGSSSRRSESTDFRAPAPPRPCEQLFDLLGLEDKWMGKW